MVDDKQHLPVEPGAPPDTARMTEEERNAYNVRKATLENNASRNQNVQNMEVAPEPLSVEEDDMARNARAQARIRATACGDTPKF